MSQRMLSSSLLELRVHKPLGPGWSLMFAQRLVDRYKVMKALIQALIEYA